MSDSSDHATFVYRGLYVRVCNDQATIYDPMDPTVALGQIDAEGDDAGVLARFWIDGFCASEVEKAIRELDG